VLDLAHRRRRREDAQNVEAKRRRELEPRQQDSLPQAPVLGESGFSGARRPSDRAVRTADSPAFCRPAIEL
jgi:hypothetical protein